MGAWFGFVYAFFGQAINWVLLPQIAIKPPAGDHPLTFILLYAFLGAVLGFIAAIPDSTWAGVASGAFVSALVATLIGLLAPSTGADPIFRRAIVSILTFLPLTVLFLPITWFIRTATNAQVPDPLQPQLWGRRYIIPAILSVGVIVIALFGMYSSSQRGAIRWMDQLIQDNTSKDRSQLPKILTPVQDFIPGARSRYQLYISDKVDDFMGPQPANRELSQFLTVAEFDSGLRFACIFVTGQPEPSYCTNF